MEISYHSAITKIQKLPKKKKISVPTSTLGTGRYCSKLADMASTWLVQPVFKPVWHIGISIPVYIPIQYIPASIGMVSTTLIWLLMNCVDFSSKP